MSEQGAKAHVSRLFLKFGVANRAGLATAVAAEADGVRRERTAKSVRAHEGELRDVSRTLRQTNTALTRENDRLRGENATLRGRRR